MSTGCHFVDSWQPSKLTDKELQDIFNSVDANKNGVIDSSEREELYRAVIEKDCEKVEGKVDRKAAITFWGDNRHKKAKGKTNKEIRDAWEAEIDKKMGKGKGEISFAQFQEFWAALNNKQGFKFTWIISTGSSSTTEGGYKKTGGTTNKLSPIY